MRTFLFSTGLALTLFFGAPALADDYTIDPVHSAVIFRIKHLKVSYTYGRFNKTTGTFSLDENEPGNTKIDLTVDVSSLDTNDPKRDGHLKGPDFFNVKQFPKATFKSKAVKKVGEDLYEVKGDMTLHGVTKEITVKVTKTGEGEDPWGGHRAGAELTFTIKRSDFGMSYMQGPVGDDVRLIVSIEGIRAK